MASLRTLHPEIQTIAAAFLRALERAGLPVTVTSTRRDAAEQQRLWDCYQRTGCSNCRRTPSCYPAAPPGSSPHDLGIAFDVDLGAPRPMPGQPVPPQYLAAGLVWEGMGYRWGGRFNDPIHFDTYPTGFQPARRIPTTAHRRSRR